MGIIDKVKGLFNKTTGGQQSAQGTAPPQDPAASVTDAGGSTTGPSTEAPAASTSSETPVEPTSEA